MKEHGNGAAINSAGRPMRKLLALVIGGIPAVLIGLAPNRAWCKANTGWESSPCRQQARVITAIRDGQPKGALFQPLQQMKEVADIGPAADRPDQDLRLQPGPPFEVLSTPLSMGWLTVGNSSEATPGGNFWVYR